MNDSTHKFVAVLSKKIEIGRLMNALAHMSAGFTNMYPEKAELKLDNYQDKDGGLHPSLSDNPFIILAADNSNQIRTLRKALLENNILFNDFTSTMVEGTAQEQKERTSKTPEEELEYWGICTFGQIEKISNLTKKFSLWR